MQNRVVMAKKERAIWAADDGSGQVLASRARAMAMCISRTPYPPRSIELAEEITQARS